MKSAGISAVTFSSAQEFLEAANDSQVDCAVTDLRMPDVDGIKLQQALAQIAPHLAIVFVTGHGDVPAGIKAMKGGAVDFLEKPVDDEALLDAVRRAADRSREALASRAGFDDLQRRYERLTPRERQVFQLITSGYSTSRRAPSSAPVRRPSRFSARAVMDKMEAASLAELVRMADQLHIQPAAKTDSKPRRSGDARTR